ncbi:unnamed protein product [Strongylus vulgaris]|uniref:Uncharacterized protein n=1 Tax=Strongylus vulgaris TaxID=40348 RepID=A0A3P7KD27_STRVU|nr:unnamed protein product [Strongylus vulgaris]
MRLLKKALFEVNEDVAISIEPPSETVAASPTIVGPGAPIHLLVVDPQKIRSRGGEKLKLKALGLISGRSHEISIDVKPDGPVTEGNVPPFEKENYVLILEHNFKEEEIAILKLEADPPSGTKFTLIGPISERFTVTNQGPLVYLTLNPCKVECTTPEAFTLLLIATYQGSQQYTTLSFTNPDKEEFTFLNTPYTAILEEETGVFKKAVKVMTKGKVKYKTVHIYCEIT